MASRSNAQTGGVRRHGLWWLIATADAVVLCVLSVVPVDVPVAEVPSLDKLAHVCEYLLFAWILVQAVRASRQPEGGYLVWAWVYATSYGLLMELVQAMVPWRSADWADAVANAIGAGVGVWIDRYTPRYAKPDT